MNEKKKKRLPANDKNWLLQLGIFALFSLVLSLFFQNFSPIFKEEWDAALQGTPLPALTTLVLKHGSILPWATYFSCIVFLVLTQLPLLRRMHRLKLHILLVFAYGQCLVCTFATFGYALPAKNIGGKLAPLPPTQQTHRVNTERILGQLTLPVGTVVKVRGRVIAHPDKGTYYYENILKHKILLEVTSVNDQVLKKTVTFEFQIDSRGIKDEIAVPKVGDQFNYMGYEKLLQTGIADEAQKFYTKPQQGRTMQIEQQFIILGKSIKGI